jgi:L-ascorbate metabolism protein UlaG (beta-lactamase superfamily)
LTRDPYLLIGAMALHLTWFDSNSWLLELGGRRILLDPWLTGPLMFGNAEWFFKGEHPAPIAPPQDLDAILLSQGLEDHAHRPTLELFARSVPVIGSPSAAAVARELGFETVVALAHGDRHCLGGTVEIVATVGAPVGPGALENGYVVRAIASPTGPGAGEAGPSVYYEPHGYHPANLAELGPIDVTLSPLLDLCIGFLPILRGGKTALELAKRVRPQVMVPTAAAGEVRYSGLLVKALRQGGTIEGFGRSLAAANLDCQVLQPTVGQRFAIPLTPRATAAIAG